MKINIPILIRLVLFIVFVTIIFIGQKTVGKIELGMMLFGLAGLIGLLYDYNRHYV